LIASRKFAALLIAVLAGAAATVYSIRAQSGGQPPNPPPPATATINPNLVVLDPAHGGPDSGAMLGENVIEKNLTLAMAAKLRGALAAAGFTVITTRDADVPDGLTSDQRAEIANRTHAVACIVLHATATGSGVHVYTSPLPPSDSVPADSDTPYTPIPWERAQAESKRQSLQLASGIVSALATTNLPHATASAPVRPLDNLMCPAVAVEIAPLAVAGTDTRPVTDAEYQQRVVDALTAALKTWRSEAAPPAPTAAAIPDPRTTAAARAIAAAEAAGRAASGGKEAQ
jgi:N-acetylmuramoyl-L-alanine amidase